MLGTRRVFDAVMVILLGVAGAFAMACTPLATGRAPAHAPREDDSVAVGYGEERKEDVTSSIATVSGEQLSEQRVARVEQLLQGRVPGVDVIPRTDGSFSIRIRNSSSAVGDTDPLYVLDGIPLPRTSIGSALDGIAPQDIARIAILKDAAATAVYGVQGANGVVLIETKHAH